MSQMEHSQQLLTTPLYVSKERTSHAVVSGLATAVLQCSRSPYHIEATVLPILQVNASLHGENGKLMLGFGSQYKCTILHAPTFADTPIDELTLDRILRPQNGTTNVIITLRCSHSHVPAFSAAQFLSQAIS